MMWHVVLVLICLPSTYFLGLLLQLVALRLWGQAIGFRRASRGSCDAEKAAHDRGADVPPDGFEARLLNWKRQFAVSYLGLRRRERAVRVCSWAVAAVLVVLAASYLW